MSRTFRTVLIYLIVIVVAVLAVNAFVSSATAPEPLTLDALEAAIDNGDVEKVTVKAESNIIVATLRDPSSSAAGYSAGEYQTPYTDGYEETLTARLLEKDPERNIEVTVDAENPGILQWLLGTILRLR